MGWPRDGDGTARPGDSGDSRDGPGSCSARSRVPVCQRHARAPAQLPAPDDAAAAPAGPPSAHQVPTARAPALACREYTGGRGGAPAPWGQRGIQLQGCPVRGAQAPSASQQTGLGGSKAKGEGGKEPPLSPCFTFWGLGTCYREAKPRHSPRTRGGGMAAAPSPHRESPGPGPPSMEHSPQSWCPQGKDGGCCHPRSLHPLRPPGLGDRAQRRGFAP